MSLIWTLGLLAGLSAFGGRLYWYLLTVLPFMAWLGGIGLTWALPRHRWRIFARLAGPAALATALVVPAAVTNFEKARPGLANMSGALEFFRAHRGEPIWVGVVDRREIAIVYIETGVWLRYPSLFVPADRDALSSGDLIAFDTRFGKPDPRDRVVFRTNIAAKEGIGRRSIVIVRRE